VDLITRSLPGGYTFDNFAKAENITRTKIAEHIRALTDFMIESNLATQKDYDWVNAMIRKGYDVVLFFLCTSLLAINIGRVKKRVAEGGHDVAEPIIEHRYKMGLTYLKGNIQLFQKAYLIDNSGETAIVMAELKNGIIQSKDQASPQWVTDVLFIAERLGK
jgi:predicted ABC-type ATPase